MTVDSTTENTTEPAPKASGGKRLVGIYFGLYFLIIITFIGYRMTQSEELAPQRWLESAFPGALTATDTTSKALAKMMQPEDAHRRAWHGHSIHFRDRRGIQVEIHEGQIINRLQAVALAGVIVDDSKKAEDQRQIQQLFVNRKGAFANIPWATLLTLYNLAGLFLLIYAFIWGPLGGFLDQSAADAADRLERAREASKIAEVAQQQQAELLAEIEAESKKFVAQAKEDTVQQHDQIIAAAKQEAEGLLATVQTGLDAQIAHARENLQADIARQAMVQAAADIAKAVTANDHDHAIDTFLHDVEKVKLG